MTSGSATGTVASAASQLRTSSEDAFRAAFREWVEANLPSQWRDKSFGATDEILSDQRRRFGQMLGEAGWLSVNWPGHVGGLGRPAESRIAVLEELVAAGAPEPMNSNVLGIFAPTLIKFGTKEQCARILPGMLSHEAIWCQGFSEPEAGSDLAAISTRGEIIGDEIVITGQKVWTSYAHIADYCYILVRTERTGKRHDGLTLVMLPMRQDGVTPRPLRNIVGTDEFCEVFLDGARAPLANVVGEVGNGWRIAMYALGQERSVGLAQRSLKLHGEFRVLAKMICGAHASNAQGPPDGISQGPLVDAYVRALVISATVRRAIELDSAGGDIGDIASVAKISWSEGHQRQMALAARFIGPDFVAGDGAGSDWFRASLFARAETIYGGTSQIQRNVLARSLGLPRGERS